MPPALNLELPTFSPRGTAAEALAAAQWLKDLCAVIDPVIKRLGARAFESGVVSSENMSLFERALENSVAGNAQWLLEDYAEAVMNGEVEMA